MKNKIITLILLLVVVNSLHAENATVSDNRSLTDIQAGQAPSSEEVVSYDALRIMLRSGEREKAISLAEDSLKKQENSDIRVLLGNMLHRDGNFAAAKQQFEIVLKNKGGNHFDASEGLINTQMSTGDYQAALGDIDQALTFNPHNKDLLAKKNQVLKKLNPVSPAAASASPSEHMLVNSNLLSYAQIRTMAHNGQSKQAIPLAQASLAVEDNSDLRMLLGAMLSWNKRYQEAEIQLNQVLKQHPDNSDAIEALVNAKIWSEDYLSALKEINSRLVKNPGNKFLLEKKQLVLADMAAAKTAKTTNLRLLANTAGLDAKTLPIADSSNEKKLNAISFDRYYAQVNDLGQNWQFDSISYKRSTPLAPIILRLNNAYRFEQHGTQYEVDAYPSLFKGSYLYLNYGYSDFSIFPKDRYGFEGFFSLPKAFEFSLGQRIMKFQDSMVHVNTGSVAKYIGNYWISYRPYVTSGMSNYLTVRRYFATADSYVSGTVGYGTAPSDLNDPEQVSAKRSQGIRFDGQIPIVNNVFFTWKVGYSVDTFPSDSKRAETDIGAGLGWRF